MEETKKKPGRPRKVATDAVEQPVVSKPVKQKKEKLKLSDSSDVLVRSNVFGRLIYIDHKTDDETNWEHAGDEQVLTVRELLNMKAKQSIFFKENWISIVGSDDVDMDEYSVADIYEALNISRYYKDSVVPDDLAEVFDWSENAVREKIKLFPVTIRESIIIMANDKIMDGTLDSISKVKLFEEVLECELASPND